MFTCGRRDAACLRVVVSWLERVLSAVDCYSWVFSQNLLTPTQLLTGWCTLYTTSDFLLLFLFVLLCIIFALKYIFA